MARHTLTEDLPPVEDEVELPEPIKITFGGAARDRMRRSLTAALESEWYERAVALRCFERLKSKIVVRTEAERDALIAHLTKYDSKAEWSPTSGHHAASLRAIRRVLGGLQAAENGEDPDKDDTPSSITVPCPDCGKVYAVAYGTDETLCLSCDAKFPVE